MRLPPVLDRLNGPPPALPRPLDAASEWWWSLPPRLRAILLLGAALTGLLALGGRLAPSPGPTVDVLVADRDLPAGHAPGQDDLRAATWPARLAPADPAGSDPTGTLTGPLPRGAVLTRQHLAEGGLGALVAEGRAAVAVPADLVPRRAAGARLALVATDADTDGRRLADAGRLLEREADHAWVEVDAGAAPAVSAAAHRRRLAVVLRPPG